MDKAAIAAELLRRGVNPDEIAKSGYPEVAQMGRTGLIAPRIVAPDKIAERGAYIRDYGELSKRRETLGQHYGENANLDKFLALNQRQGTGGIVTKIPYVKDAFEMLHPEVQEMAGISSTLQGKARPVGSGATSDFEQRLYRQGVPSPEKIGPVNQSIIAYMKGTMKEESDRTAFDEEFMRRNGSLSGSQEAWGRYVGQHPYTVTDQRGHSKLNTQRVDWGTYFGTSPRKPVGPVAGPAGAPRVNDPIGIRGRR